MASNFAEFQTESPVLYEQAIQKIHHLFEKDQNIKSFLNFGVSYAHVDSILAKMHPEIHFVGIDRAPFTKLYNENYFSQIQNLEFVAGDVLEFLNTAEKKFENGVFFI